ncbi:MAG: 2-succinyl-6-hydroxy-2,4-cyclohexadiene-1-carboxylate synthase [Chlamydiae bacterium]|nr:2-succinyl-6-hydroxy-2,4-cyclohexadiene-1-carboxylate synthase [Chlamydiota bacterium]
MQEEFQGHVLHGFLGVPDDWAFLEKWNRIDLFDEKSFLPRKGLLPWARAFNSSVADSDQKNIIMGYSLGGRLALHALVDRPGLWDAAVIISAHPGLKNQEEKEERLRSDEKWANRFLTESWGSLMEEWNAQSVFSGKSLLPLRDEKNYSRTTLAEVLTGWSLGRQEDLRSKIEKLSIPVLWVVGEWDRKFVSIAKELKFSHPNSKVWIASEAGHRVPWQQTNAFSQELKTFFIMLREIL